ncbi:putative hydrolase of the HAD superfamily [Hasllibacter halocynthiae]|uniref:Putative hydrolase of the HAD superfamily n=1 Tax=Hasllibacter halocynthiae TaxID=595589 RepID=A0A2T0X6B4_9RHOB|nr:pyrimidine 5'-nucleotidase [Hasllibacter halocynthiae]PRY94467.1 putative hydrolase of the HAD superfamily [Hasllibacter halocynthiae]
MALADVRTWIFDLDNTLYPPEARLFAQIEAKMREWMVRDLEVTEAEADRLRALYWREHGTTLAGLMARHGTHPDDFLRHVHEIDLSALRPDPALRTALGALPGRRIVFTNGTAEYAGRVAAALGLEEAFDALYGIEEAGLVPKPHKAAFEAIRRLDGFDAAGAAMFEDDARNLLVPHEWGMETIHVAPRRAEGAHVRHHARDLASFLGGLAGRTPAPS